MAATSATSLVTNSLAISCDVVCRLLSRAQGRPRSQLEIQKGSQSMSSPTTRESIVGSYRRRWTKPLPRSADIHSRATDKPAIARAK